MATWSEVFDGMQKGGTATQAGLNAINTEVESNTAALKYYGDAKIALAATAYSKAGELYLNRVGKLCLLYGAINMTTAAQWKTLVPMASIPKGYTPNARTAVNSTWGSTSYAGMFAYLYLNDSGIQVITPNSAVGACQGQIWWFTDDDYPA